MADTEPTGGMTPAQHLRSEAIYRINSVVRSIIEEDMAKPEDDRLFTERIQLQPTLFDPSLRKFRWLLVDQEDWCLNVDLLRALAKFVSELDKDEKRKFKEVWKKIAADLQAPRENIACLWNKAVFDNNDDSIEPLIKEDEKQRYCHHVFMKILEGRIFDPKRYMDGLVFECIKGQADEKKPLARIDSTVMDNADDNWTKAAVFPPLSNLIARYDNHPEKQIPWYSQDHGERFDNPKDLSSRYESQIEMPWQVKVEAVVARKVKAKRIVSVPIYDGGIIRLSYGRLVGIVHTVIDDDQERSKEVKECREKIADRIRSYQERLVGAFRAAAFASIGNEPITTDDRNAERKDISPTVHHFLRILPMIQDWETIKVSWTDLGPRRYVLRRGSEGKWEWKEDVNGTACKEKSSAQRWMEAPLPLLDMIEARWLQSSEKRALENLYFEFEFPDYAILPEENLQRSRLERQYIQDQIDIWRIVLPKVFMQERIRRHAIQTAATAIMSRNLSHNIGSHVLARYANKIGTDNPSHSKSDTDHRGEFLAYLQRRMDFLAEVSTSERAFWMQALSLQHQIDQMNYCKQKIRYGDEADPILLRFITGKEELKATVKYEGEDMQFTCPSGEVGVHALFVILENIIRNSARHGNVTGRDTVELRVRVDRCGSTDDLLKLEIVDAGSKVAGGGEGEVSLPQKINCIVGDPFLDEDGKAEPENWGVREMQICAHYLRGFSLHDLDGAPEGTLPVLEAGCHDGKLKYTVYLHRAKRVAVVVGNDPTALSQETIETLRVQGIRVIVAGNSPDWDKIGARASGYEFLVVEEGIEGLPNCVRSRAASSLPVRTLRLPRKKVKCLIDNAAADCSSWMWMESLHKCWAGQIRDKRSAWKDKPLFGVAISTEQALQPARDDCWPASTPCDGLIFARKSLTCPIRKPLPESAGLWLDRLTQSENQERHAIAAAWVDHATREDFSARGCGLGQSGKPKPRNQRERRWISGEGARSGDPHARFLNDRSQGSEWEILAAAIPRVAVLDERVQSAGDEDSSVAGMKRHELWRYMGVWAPKKPGQDDGGGCNLDTPNFDECKKFLEKPAERCEQYPIDILVVHLTILERLTLDCEETTDRTLHRLLRGTQAENAEVVVVTGRGVPAVARAAGGDKGRALRGVRYLPISALLESLVSRPSKLGVLRTLWSAGVPMSANV